jgi:glycosyltransferase involved in cell wall biosynthesis
MTQNKPPVSIYVTTCLNSPERGEVLRVTCENMLAQNYPEFEVVVSDNAGRYPAEKALADIDDPRLRIVRNKENLGQVGNSNGCLERCRYDIIKVNCDDDLLHPDCLKITVPYVDDETYVTVDKSMYPIGEFPPELNEALPDDLIVEKRAPGYRKDIWSFTHVSLPGCCLFTRKLFSDLGRYDETPVFFDYDFLIETRLSKNNILVKQPLCFMGFWDQSFSHCTSQANPYFFSIGSLYTKFRLLKCKKLKPLDKLGLLLKLIRWFLKESLRPIRHPFKAKYWRGYADLICNLFKYMILPASRYGFHIDPRQVGRVD